MFSCTGRVSHPEVIYSVSADDLNCVPWAYCDESGVIRARRQWLEDGAINSMTSGQNSYACTYLLGSIRWHDVTDVYVTDNSL